MRARTDAELDEEQAEEAAADDRHRLARADAAPGEDVHRAADRLAGERAVQFVGKHHDGLARNRLELGVGGVGDERDAAAGLDLDAPALVPRRAGRERVRKPGAPLPERDARRADAAALDADEDVPGPRLGRGHAREADAPG